MKILLKIGDVDSPVGDFQTALQAKEAIKEVFTEGAKIWVKVLKNDEAEDAVEFAEFDGTVEADEHIDAVVTEGETVHVPVTDEEAGEEAKAEDSADTGEESEA